MARSSTFAAVKSADSVMIRAAGILALGLSLLFEGIICTPLCSTPTSLSIPLLLAAGFQIGAGLNEWRHHRVLESTVLVAFGLFTCSQISQLFSPPTTGGGLLVQGFFLLFWSLFAVLVSSQPSDFGRTFHLLLAAVSITLFIKALILIFAWRTLWPLSLATGGSSLILAAVTVFKDLPERQS